MEKTLIVVCDTRPEPSMMLGESVVRQLKAGREYFLERFREEPTLIFFFNSFLHSRGIVQLLAGSGCNTYLFEENDNTNKSIPAQTFNWQGFDGSSVLAHRISGLSEDDIIRDIQQFSFSKESLHDLPLFRGDFNLSPAGYHNSVCSLNRKFYKVEHMFFTAEKLLSLASLSGGPACNASGMKDVMNEMLLTRYQDLFPEKSRLKEEVMTGIVEKVKDKIDEEMASFHAIYGRSFINKASGEYSVTVINPHPFDVSTTCEIELQLPELWTDEGGCVSVIVSDEKGERVFAQVEQPQKSKIADRRKKIIFHATVPGGSSTGYSCSLKNYPDYSSGLKQGPDFVFTTDKSKLVFDSTTGFPSVYEYAGNQLLSREKMNFTLIEENKSPVSSSLTAAVLISEAGPVRTILESLFSCGGLKIHARYLIPNSEPYFDIEISAAGLERGKILKWEIPAGFNMNCIGRTLSGINCCKHRKREFVFRDWLGMKNFEGDISLSICADGPYFYDISGNTVRITLAGENDSSEQTYRFRFFPGYTNEVIDRSFNNSDLFNNPLITSVGYPDENIRAVFSGIRISDPCINLQSVNLNDSSDLVLRLLNPSKETRSFTIDIRPMNLKAGVEIGSKKLKTLVLEKASGRFFETDLLEKKRT